jgi:hypothetical protein
MLIRCLIRRHLETLPTSAWTHQELAFDDVWQLCANQDAFPEERLREFQAVAQVLLEFCRIHLSLDANPLDMNALMELVCKEECNSFGLYHHDDPDDQRHSYGLAVYPRAVYFNHSCDPNVVHMTKGKNELFFAMRSIQQGEELTITYIDLRQSTAERLAELEKVFLFTCDCKRCRASQEDGNKYNDAWLNMRLCQRTGCHGWYLPYNNEGDVGIVPGSQGMRIQEWKCEACSSVRK